MKRLVPFFFLVLSLTGALARAGIVYTDIPDGAPTGLDFNGDGIKEFTISSDPGCVANYITYTTPSNVYSPGSSAWDTAAALTAGFSIGTGGNWFGFIDCTVNGFGPTTSFPLNVDRYIGFRINYNGNLHYGWARVYMTGSNGSYTVTWKDYAYESTSGTAISAGATGLGLPDDLQDQVRIYPNPATDRLFVAHSVTTGSAFSYTLLDSTGRRIASGETTDGGPIPVASLPGGAYLLRIDEADHSSTRRFVKK